MDDNLEALGSGRFANAGFRINLNNQDIALFFKALYDTKTITVENDDGSGLSKRKLAQFIQANFSANQSENISTNTLTRYLSANEDFSEQIEKLFADLAKHVKRS